MLEGASPTESLRGLESCRVGSAKCGEGHRLHYDYGELRRGE